MSEQEKQEFIELLMKHPEKWGQVKAILASPEQADVSQETQPLTSA